MKIIQKLLTFAVAIVLGAGVAFTFSACDNNTQDGKKNIICTIYPSYDWTMQILGEQKDNYNVNFITNGTELHSFNPTPANIIEISTADIFIYVGGESDEWADKILKNATNKNMIVINLLEILGDNAKQEEVKEGMEPVEDEGEEETEYDEHVWLSLKNAKIFVNEIATQLGKLDETNKDVFLQNATLYNQELENLDVQYTNEVNSASTKTILVADRFPFRYLVEDYNLNYYAAFVGCSSETRATPQTITFLANKIDELTLKNIIILENSDSEIANTVKNSTQAKNQQILVLNSIQSTTLKDNITYLQLMTNNLQVLKQALN